METEQIVQEILEAVHILDGDCQQRLVEELRKQPTLARARYRPHQHPADQVHGPGHYLTWYPLVHLIYAGAQLEIIEEVWGMYPAALSQPFGIWQVGSMHPLSMALCFRGNETKLIQFLVEKHPEAVSKTCYTVNTDRYSPINQFGLNINPYGISSIQVAMHQEAPKETIKLLVDGASCFGRLFRWDWNGPDSFSLAHSTYGDGEVLDMIGQAIQKSAAANEDTTYNLKDQFAAQLHQHAKLQKLLLLLKNVWYVDNGETQNGGWNAFFGGLACNETVTRLKLDCIPENYIACDALEHCLKHNTTLEQLQLEFIDQEDDEERTETDSFLEGIIRGLACNGPLQGLDVAGGTVRNVSILNKLIKESSQLTSLEIAHFLITEEDEEAMETNETPASVAGTELRCVSFIKNDIPAACLLEMVKTAALLPYLHSLTIIQTEEGTLDNEVDFTQPLIQLLAKDLIRSLKLDGILHLDTGSLVEALKHNKSLHTLKYSGFIPQDEPHLLGVLESQNTTLCSVVFVGPFPFTDEGTEKLELLQNFNLHVRKEIQPGFCLHDLVSLLCDLVLNDWKWVNCLEFPERYMWDEYTLTCNHQIQLFNLHYCLLLQYPGLWSLANDELGKSKPSERTTAKSTKKRET